MDHHFENTEILTTEYLSAFTRVYEKNLCTDASFIRLNLIPFNCSTFISASPVYVRPIYPNLP
jgi:hypothetical protein